MVIKTTEDRRVRKTKTALRRSLAELLNEKSIQHITVRELTEKADIHRSTFYANFNDIYELYNHMEDTTLQEISDIVLVDYAFNPNVFFRGLLDYVNKNKQVSRLFFGQNIKAAFFERLTNMVKNAGIECWRKEYNVTSISEEMDYYIQFCLSGGLGVIGMWVSRNYDYPMETLVEMLSDIDSGVGKVFGSKFS